MNTLTDPNDIKPRFRQVLGTVYKYRNIIRCSGGYRVSGSPRVMPIKTVEWLEARGLVRRCTIRGRATLDITGTGRMVIGVMQERGTKH